MSWFSNLFTSGAGEAVEKVSSGLDSLFTSDEERLQAKNVLQQAMNEFSVEMEKAANQFESEITERWKSDNEHIITRLVRPVSFAFTLFLFALMVLFDGNIGGFTVNPGYHEIIKTLLVTMVVAYFGSRGAEKVFKK